MLRPLNALQVDAFLDHLPQRTTDRQSQAGYCVLIMALLPLRTHNIVIHAKK